MFKYLIDIIKKIEGNVLTIGIDDKLLIGFNKNDKVNVYTLDRAKGLFGKSKKRKDNQGKTINIKKLKKYFHKKSLDYIIIDYNEIVDYLKYVVRDIVLLNSNNTYIYCDNDCDIDIIANRFRRYGAKAKIKSFKDKLVIEIDNSNSKTNWFKNKIYYIKDTIYNIGEFISNILIS